MRILGSLVRRFAETHENQWQITSLVTQKSLFRVTYALFFNGIAVSYEIHAYHILVPAGKI